MMENVIRYVREMENESRSLRDEDPITDEDLAGRLLSMRYFAAAEFLLSTVYADADRGKP